MWISIIIAILYTKQYVCLDLIDLPEDYGSEESPSVHIFENDNSFTPDNDDIKNNRRYWIEPIKNGVNIKGQPLKAARIDDDKDENLKNKITTLVQQTLHDTERKMKTVQTLKEKYRDQAPYRAGFILSMVKKSRDALNELFNLAVRHRDDWIALQQMQVFENIVHTNVDTTNLVRQLVEIHIQHLNTTSGGKGGDGSSGLRKRVVLI